MTTVIELKAKYPYMFDGPHSGIDIYAGWLPILSATCDAIDDVLGPTKAGFHFRQIKEKYGSARLYWSAEFCDDAQLRRIGALIRNAENATQSVCMLCGALAEMKKYDGWLLCLCDIHGRERLSKSKDSSRGKNSS